MVGYGHCRFDRRCQCVSFREQLFLATLVSAGWGQAGQCFGHTVVQPAV